MQTKDYSQLLHKLAEEYTNHAPKSAALNQKARNYLVDGGSHALRLTDPFPPRITSARGAWIKDEDGHDIIDLWQGHFANILGHNPEIVTSAAAEALKGGFGLQAGFADRLQVEVAEILCRQTGAERVRFTTSGTLSTMYAIMLARTFTGRELVLKVGGGWHGAQPWGLKGVGFHAENNLGFQQVETEGLSAGLTDEVIVTDFNDLDKLHDHFRQYGDRLACFIVEPVVGGGGAIAARPEYLRAARRLTQQYGAILILDEVISGFRFRAGDAGALYGVHPDLATFGKIIGGGLPVAAVAGRADIMDLVGRGGSHRVKFSGGTYSAHPVSLLAAKVMTTYLVEHEAEIYLRLAHLGEKLRQTVEAAFAEEDIYVYCTGAGNEALQGGSLAMLYFPHLTGRKLHTPEDTNNPAICDTVLGEQVLPLAMLLENVYVAHGMGALSTAHSEEEIAQLGRAYHRVAHRLRAFTGS